jgi:hypothetical protein
MGEEQEYTPEALRAKLWQVWSIVEGIVDDIDKFHDTPVPGETRHEAEHRLYSLLTLIEGNSLLLNEIKHKVTELIVNAYIPPQVEKHGEDYEGKKQLVRYWNEFLRGSAIAHPETGRPCMLLAVGSRDKAGRYVLEDRETRKRTGAYKTLLDILPVKIVADLPRKEGFIERRKRKE